jgi:hypothetical protein
MRLRKERIRWRLQAATELARFDPFVPATTGVSPSHGTVATWHYGTTTRERPNRLPERRHVPIAHLCALVVSLKPYGFFTKTKGASFNVNVPPPESGITAGVRLPWNVPPVTVPVNPSKKAGPKVVTALPVIEKLTAL